MSAPIGWRIGIVCTDSAHSAKQCKVTSYTLVLPGEVYPALDGLPAEWVRDLEAVRSFGLIDWHRLAQRGRVRGQRLDGDLTADEVEVIRYSGDPDDLELLDHGVTASPVQPEWRTRYVDCCRLCGLNVAYRHERVVPVLDKLAANGITSVELSHLAAIIT